MKYLKIYEDFNSKDEELKTMFGLVMGNTEVYKIPYSYYGTATKESRDFDIYVVSGVRSESNDHKLVQELYHNHEILNELLNLEFFHIGLSKKYATIVLYDYITNPSYNKNVKNHLSDIYTSKLPLPSNIKSRLKFYKTNSRLSVRPDGDYLHKGIDWSNGGGSNLSLYDWIYEKPERYTDDDIIKANSISESNDNKVDEFMYIVKDKLLELSDIGFGSYLEDKNSEPLLGDMVRITIDKERRSDRSFSFSECEDLLSDIILTNKDMKAFKTVHIIITPNRAENHRSIRLEYNEVTGRFHPEGNSNPNLNYVNPLRRVELFFEN